MTLACTVAGASDRATAATRRTVDTVIRLMSISLLSAVAGRGSKRRAKIVLAQRAVSTR
jgi:hypothetical protein